MNSISESLRLQAIERYEILDTPPEESFDRIVAIVSAVFEVPFAMITLVDRERSWYKAEVGMGVSEMARDDNMCDVTIRQDGVYVVNDSHLAQRDQVLPLLKKGMRFYVGAPLRTHEGIKIGTVCAVDVRPREVTEKEKQILADLAEMVIDELELRLAARRMVESDEELRRLNQSLEAANRNKSEFLASMSHELRTPLNGILGASELLGQGLFGELNPKQQEYVGDIHQSGMHLLRLIDDVLDLARVEAGQVVLHPERIDVAVLMEGCAAVVRGLASARSLQLTVSPPPETVLLEVDPRHITQVACNLLSNALKFSPENGKVAFRAWQDADRVTFLVEDEGRGIPPEFQGRIFEQFYRLANDLEGTGLGLPLAKQLLELHGGRIWLESEPAKGSRFFFSLPLPHI